MEEDEQRKTTTKTTEGMTQFGRPKREQSLLDLATDEPKCKKPRRGGSAMDGQWLRAARDWDGGPAMDYGSRCRLVDHVPVMSQARSSWLRLLVVPVTPARTVAKKERGWRGEKIISVSYNSSSVFTCQVLIGYWKNKNARHISSFQKDLLSALAGHMQHLTLSV